MFATLNLHERMFNLHVKIEIYVTSTLHWKMYILNFNNINLAIAIGVKFTWKSYNLTNL